MPEPIRSEEDVNREQSLCLLTVGPGNTVPNRCSNCPGAASSHLQRRRCPFYVAEPEVKSLESSSSEVPEAESLADEVSKLSLADSTAGETSSATPSQDVGSKRKVDDILRYQTTEDDLMNKAPKLFEEFPNPNRNKHMKQLMRISEENHEAASPSMITAGHIAGFSLDINKPGVHATSHDMEIDETQMR